MWAGIVQLVQRLAMGCTVWGSNPIGGEIFYTCQTAPGAHPVSITMGTGSFPRVKRPGCGVDHPSPFSAEVKERVEVYLYSPTGPLWPLIGKTVPFTFF